jgi:hypothetical protein
MIQVLLVFAGLCGNVIPFTLLADYNTPNLKIYHNQKYNFCK